MEDPAASFFYTHSPASSFSLFPNNSLYHATEPPSARPHELQHQPPRSMMYTSIGNYHSRNFSIADSPQSTTSLSNSDQSPSQSPTDYITGNDQLHYGHDLFDHLKAMFTPPAMDSLSCSSNNRAEINHRFIIKQEHQHTPLLDSYQPYIDTCNESLLSYHPSQHSHTADTNPEHFGSTSVTTPSLTYGFEHGFHNLTVPSPATSPSGEVVDLIGTNPDYNLAAMRYSAVHSSNVITQPPCAQPAQLSPQFVHTQELPSSPHTYAEIPDAQVHDPRFVSGGQDDGRLSDVALQMENGRKRKRRDSVLSATSPVLAASPSTHTGSQAPSSEGDQEQDGMEDGEYEDSGESDLDADGRDLENDGLPSRPSRPTGSTRSPNTRRRTNLELGPLSLSNSSGALEGGAPIMAAPVKRTRGLTAPIPVPNLTKKSRGRRVPTASTIVSQGGVQKNTRAYMCKVKDCSKCFSRGEHLKRHVRSIHTNEKPHKCSFPGCNKDFSRHDNLGQHMRVHKNYSAPGDLTR